MSVSHFIPEVWSARLQASLRKELVFGRLVNRRWEGEISRHGDTVHINTLTEVSVKPYVPGSDIDDPEALSGTDLTLTVDHSRYVNFYLSDVDAAQARADLMDAAMGSAARRLAEDTEDYILSVIRADAGVKRSLSVAAGQTYEALLSIKTAMDEANVPRSGRKLVMPPTVEADLLKDPRFASAGTAVGERALADGAIARAAGFDIYISNDLNDEIVALTEDGVTFAQQILNFEAYRREKGFDDAVKALSVCGAKVVVPACVCLFTLTEGGNS